MTTTPRLVFVVPDGLDDSDRVSGGNVYDQHVRDGLRDRGQYTRDIFSLQAVEVLKGPSSMLFGRGSTGGVINMNSKWPIFGTAPVPYSSPMPVKAPTVVGLPSADFVDLMVTGHTGPGIRSILDANKQLNEYAAARVQVMGQRYDIPGRDNVEENRWGVAPSLTYKFNEQTRATFAYIYQHDNNVTDRGVPYLPATWGLPRFPAPVPRNT